MPENDILELTELPPLVHTYTANYTTIADLKKTELNRATTNATRRIQEFVPPVVYNWSAGVQRDVGLDVVVDAAYVGNAARRQPISRELNSAVPTDTGSSHPASIPTNTIAG
jgi:hypothetical protein